MNPIQSILVHVDAGSHCETRLQIARALAGQLGAGVTALYAATPGYVKVSALFTAGLPNEALVVAHEARVAAARQRVSQACLEPGVQIEWAEAHEAPEGSFVRQALYADLLVLGQHDPDQHDAGVHPDFVPSVVLASGRPALVVPCVGAQPPTFDTVLVTWKETREAARALTAALPVLATAGTVHVVLDAGIADVHKTLLRRFLQRHGVEPRLHALADAGPEVGDLMLSMAADLGADLMVMGCYGHTWGRELVVGGASRTVLRSMTLPVLMAH